MALAEVAFLFKQNQARVGARTTTFTSGAQFSTQASPVALLAVRLGFISTDNHHSQLKLVKVPPKAGLLFVLFCCLAGHVGSTSPESRVLLP